MSNTSRSIYDVKSTFNSEKSRQQFNNSTQLSFNMFQSNNKKTLLENIQPLNNEIDKVLNTNCTYPQCSRKIKSLYSTCCIKHDFYVPPPIIL